VLASRFLASAFPVGTEAEAREALTAREREYFDASHHCSAWRLSDGTWRANDAGEPSGSAGAPILRAIDTAGLLDCAVIVTRYFGGTKLGVGGLAKAYGEAARTALEAAPRREAIPALLIRIGYAYAHTAAVMRSLERFGAFSIDHGFSDEGNRGLVEAVVSTRVAEALRESLREETCDSVVTEVLQPTVRHADIL
jgi:uncharacterized YigZ family protein